MVYAGIVTRSSAKMAQHTGYAVEKIIYNKDYNHRSHDGDIALMKLRTPLNFSGWSSIQRNNKSPSDIFFNVLVMTLFHPSVDDKPSSSGV